MLSIEKLSVSVSGTNLISDLSVSLFPGSITYITGKNGVGKTSMLQSLAGLKKYEGDVYFNKLKLEDFYKPYCLYIGHKLGLNPDMKVIDHLEFWGMSYNSSEMIVAAINFWDLNAIAEERVANLSAGNAKKVALSKLTCCHSPLWLLDEADTNLDENNMKFLEFAITAKANSGGIIIMTSHSQKKIKGSHTINLGEYSAKPS